MASDVMPWVPTKVFGLDPHLKSRLPPESEVSFEVDGEGIRSAR